MAVLVIANQNWLFSIPRWLDPFCFIPYFMHWFDDLSSSWEDYYKASRVPYIFFNAILHKVFPFEIAHYGNVVLLFVTYFFSYKTAKLFFDTRISILALLFFMCCEVLINPVLNGGYHYQPTPSIACLMAGIYYFLLFLFQNKTQKTLFISCILLCTTILDHTSHAQEVLALAVVYFIINKFEVGKLKTDILTATAGLTSTILFWGGINVLRGGKFSTIFVQTIWGISGVINKGAVVYFFKLSQFIDNAYHLMPEFLAMVILLILICVHKRYILSIKAREHLVISTLFLISLLAHCLLHLCLQPVLQYSYYTQDMLPYTYLMFALGLNMLYGREIEKVPVHVVLLIGLTFIVIPFITASNLDSVNDLIFALLRVKNNVFAGCALSLSIIGIVILIKRVFLAQHSLIFISFSVILLSYLNLSISPAHKEDNVYFSIFKRQNHDSRDFNFMIYDSNLMLREIDRRYHLKTTSAHYFFSNLECYDFTYISVRQGVFVNLIRQFDDCYHPDRNIDFSQMKKNITRFYPDSLQPDQLSGKFLIFNLKNFADYYHFSKILGEGLNAKIILLEKNYIHRGKFGYWFILSRIVV